MLFNSTVFVTRFLPICLIGFFLIGRIGGAPWALRWLVGASLFFYGWWNPRFVLLLAGSIAFNYRLGQFLLRQSLLHETHAGRVRWDLRVGGAANLALLGWFKYADFFTRSVSGLTGLSLPVLHLFLPLAISFFTFQQIMFLVDSARADRQDLGFWPYAAFVAFFPHLIAGPIVRPREIIPQFTAPDLARFRPDNLAEGLTLFLLGMAKKLLLADNIAILADRGFNAAAHGQTLTWVEAWIAAAAYGLQIYFDFSGYSDMAIGLARMLNIRFPLNFDSPYQSLNIAEFWRRWHITLGQFLRDYVYIGLGGNRRGTVRRDANLLATMLLGGLWHGAAWTYVLWGGLHGVYLVFHARLRGTAVARAWPRPLSRAVLLILVLVAWVPFRAESLSISWAVLRSMAGLNGVALSPFVVRFLPWTPLFIHAAPLLPILRNGLPLGLPATLLAIGVPGGAALLLPHVHGMTPVQRRVAMLASLGLTMHALFFSDSVAPFLYFQF